MENLKASEYNEHRGTTDPKPQNHRDHGLVAVLEDGAARQTHFGVHVVFLVPPPEEAASSKPAQSTVATVGLPRRQLLMLPRSLGASPARKGKDLLPVSHGGAEQDQLPHKWNHLQVQAEGTL